MARGMLRCRSLLRREAFESWTGINSSPCSRPRPGAPNRLNAPDLAPILGPFENRRHNTDSADPQKCLKPSELGNPLGAQGIGHCGYVHLVGVLMPKVRSSGLSWLICEDLGAETREPTRRPVIQRVGCWLLFLLGPAPRSRMDLHPCEAAPPRLQTQTDPGGRTCSTACMRPVHCQNPVVEKDAA